MEIKIKSEGNTKIVSIIGKLEIKNIAEAESKLNEIGDTEKVIFDCEELEYISSVGLRLILKIGKKIKNVSIKNCSDEVFDVFQMTGFAKMFDVQKKLREISVEGAKVIGNGTVSTIYRISDDKIAKFYDEGVSLEKIKEEKERAELAFLNGVPTAISYDIVKNGNRYGIIFELLDAKNLSEVIKENPDQLENIVDKEVQLLKKFHKMSFEKNALPSIKEIGHTYVDKLNNYCSADEMKVLHKLIDDVPDRNTFLHSDFHPKNIIDSNGELFLIDMADVSLGHPIFDLCGVYFSNVFLAKRYPQYMPQILGLDAEILLKRFKLFLPKYFETDDKKFLDTAEKMLSEFAWLKILILLPEEPATLTTAEDKNERAELAKKILLTGDFVEKYREILEKL